MKSYIYKITNKVNNNIYIGQTSRTVEERYREHLSSAFSKNLDQPLYRAMRKYGKDAFEVVTIEECSVEDVNNREIYYINKYDSYNDGYNATLGGDGKPVNDYKQLARDFLNSGLSITQYSKEYHLKVSTIRNALNTSNLMDEYREKHPEYNTRFNTIAVKMLDQESNQVINIFESIRKALNYLNVDEDKGHIKAVCNGKRNSAYGYKWQFA